MSGCMQSGCMQVREGAEARALVPRAHVRLYRPVPARGLLRHRQLLFPQGGTREGGHALQVASYQVTSYKLRAKSHTLQVASRKLRVAGYKATGYKSQATGRRLQVTSRNSQTASAVTCNL